MKKLNSSSHLTSKVLNAVSISIDHSLEKQIWNSIHDFIDSSDLSFLTNPMLWDVVDLSENLTWISVRLLIIDSIGNQVDMLNETV